MNPAWPLDRMLLAGLRGGAGDGVLRSKVARGPMRQQPLYSATPEPLEGEILMTGAQLQTFRDWGRVQLQEWSQAFDLPDPATEAPRAFQFVRQPSWIYDVTVRYPRGRWRVQVFLESIP